MDDTKRQQQSLTDFFLAKRSIKPKAKEADQAQDIPIQTKKICRRTSSLPDDSAFQSYESLPASRTNVLIANEIQEDGEEPYKQPFEKETPASTIRKSPKSNDKNVLLRMEAKRSALRAAKEKLRQFEKDQTALKQFQLSKRTRDSEPVHTPAYEKYHYLTAPAGVLPLPIHYQRLLDGFAACDTVVSMCHNRKEICRLDKVSTAVRSITRHDFDLSHLGKILYINPEAYLVSVEEHRFLDTNERRHHILSFVNPPRGQNPKFVVERRSHFKDKLLLRVAQYHQEFLDKEMPGSDVPVEAIKRWHPKFLLDSVPDIPVNDIPQLQKTTQIANAQEVLEKVRNKFSVRIEKALETLAEKQAQEKTDKSANKLSTTPTCVTLHGVNQNLLERIRKKEALKMAEKMVINGQDEKERRVLQALPGLVRTIRQVFLSSKKTTLPYPDLVARIRESGSFGDIETLMTRVAELAPEWYKPLIVRNAKYVKIDKNRDVNSLCEQVERRLKNAGSSKLF
ncbi:DNA replication factor Cdt1-like [Tropilaelaps mercedesae]|uniref:DNA replication factor Cdt1-like n=1 Tax=Tropilaelaps mercedesae TaxID=418985 RepID=A0A1V9XY84_9ACAR|nr:DNA replication factor Cdt1-like [Tropilaelaps mercedesae]